MRFQMKLTAHNIIALVFVATSLVSLGFIFAASLNYNNYYWQARSAMLDSTSNNTIVRSVGAIRDPNTGMITIRARVSSTNPTGYRGLTLDHFAVTLFCLHTGNINQSIFTPNNLLANSSPSESLDPYSTITRDIDFNLSATQSNQLRAFNQTYNGDVEAHVVMTTSITSFFDSVFGGITINKAQVLPISWS